MSERRWWWIAGLAVNSFVAGIRIAQHNTPFFLFSVFLMACSVYFIASAPLTARKR